MRDQIADAAKAAGRSMNAEIIHRLQESLSSKGMAPEIQDRWARIRSLERRKNVLLMNIAQHQAMALHLTDRIAEAMASGNKDEQRSLQMERNSSRSEIYRYEGEMFNIAKEIDDLYEQVSTDAPGSNVRII